MQVPLTITYRNVPKTTATETLIRKQAAKLERVHPRIIRCRVAVENRQTHQRTGSRFRVRVSVTVPPEHQLAAVRDESEGELHEQLPTVIRRSFEALRRQLAKINQKQRGAVKTHPQQLPSGIVARLFPQEGYGFIENLEGREIYFHKNSLTGEEFERLEVGTAVHWTETEGEKGPQATTVRTVASPGPKVRRARSAERKA